MKIIFTVNDNEDIFVLTLSPFSPGKPGIPFLPISPYEILVRI